MNASAYGDSIDRILDRWQDVIDGPMPQMHLMLNIVPAPWLISNEYKYSWDRQYRTLSNEYKKNLATIESAKKHDFVRSVVDLFSIELPFNGKPGSASAHNDAVHVSSKSSMGQKFLVLPVIVSLRLCVTPSNSVAVRDSVERTSSVTVTLGAPL